MIDMRFSVRLDGREVLKYEEGEGISSFLPASSEKFIKDLLERKINIKFMRIIDARIKEFFQKHRKSLISTYLEFCKAEMQRRNQMGSGDVFSSLARTEGIFHFTKGRKPASILFKITPKHARKFFNYATKYGDMADLKFNNFLDEELTIRWIKKKGFTHVKEYDETGKWTGEYLRATPQEIFSAMINGKRRATSSKFIYKRKRIVNGIIWSEYIRERKTTTLEYVTEKYERYLTDLINKNLTKFFKSKKIQVFNKSK